MSHKKAKVRNLRNILSTPFNIQWSESNPEGLASLQKTLEELLPLAKLERKSLKIISKSKTKEKVPPGSPRKQNNIFRTYLAPGFQSVIRGLEKHELCCVLLAKNITPPMIPRVICSYCDTYNIPLMIVPELKTTTKTTLGFPAMVLGFKKIAKSSENPFFPVYEIILQNRSILETSLTLKLNTDLSPEETNNSVLKYESSSLSPAKGKDFYLFRESREERVFRPGMKINSKANTRAQPNHGLDGDFISFSKGENSSLEFLSRKTLKTGGKSESENDSDCDSLDEDNIFFVDDKPDQMLLDIDLSRNKEAENSGVQQVDGKLPQNQEIEDSTKKNVINMSNRYFSGKEKQDEKPINEKNKEKKQSKKETFLKKAERKEKLCTSKFNPLTIKTIISNPKKIRRKKKH